jgi:hypothetical protein
MDVLTHWLENFGAGNFFFEDFNFFPLYFVQSQRKEKLLPDKN